MKSSLTKTVCTVGAALLISALSPLDSRAGDDSDLGDLPVPPTLEPKIPDAREGIVISSTNAFQYRSIIVPELFGSVKTGIVEFSAVRKLKFEPVGYINRDAIVDPVVKPGEFLSQISAALSTEKILDVDFDLITLKESRVVRQFQGALVRIYPKELNSGDKTGQLFKERISILAPTPLRGFSYLTFRFLGGDEDVYWIYSPGIKKARQLTGSNRPDGILRTQFSPDDIFGWSGKGDLVEGELGTKLTVLAPFLSDEVVVPTRKGGCAEVKREESGEEESSPARWNVSSRRFPQAAPWLPTNAVFVPREVYRIELESKDAYSLYGRQILYVDAVTLLPYYKFVFDRSGHPWKTVVSGYSGRQGIEKESPRLVPAFTVVEDTLKSESFILDIARYASCGELPVKYKPTDFDPRHMGAESAPPAESSSPELSDTPVTSPEENKPPLD